MSAEPVNLHPEIDVFQPHVNVATAIAQITAVSQTQLRFLPQGTTPPLVISYTALSVPILQLGLSSKTLREQEIFDIGNNFIRTQLATVQGASIPLPYGGRQRQIQVDLDANALQAKNLTPVDVVTAVGAQSLILPAGTS
jgi:multidrug efflux pump subunit AcrB